MRSALDHATALIRGPPQRQGEQRGPADEFFPRYRSESAGRAAVKRLKPRDAVSAQNTRICPTPTAILADGTTHLTALRD